MYNYARDTRLHARGEMKLFGKEITKKQRRELLMQLLAVVLSGIFAITLGVVSFAWFSMNRSLEQSGMQVVVSSETVELLIDRTDEYDTGYEGITGEAGLKATLAAENFSLSATDTRYSALLAYELIVAEETYENKRYLVPGAYGTMTFYIRPRTGHDGEIIHLMLSFDGYADFYEEGEEDPTIQRVTKESVNNLLKGHILFFEGRTGATQNAFIYTGQITGSGFDYDMSQHSKCDEVGKTDCYEITLYWEWPITYYTIHDGLSTLSTTKKFPVETGTYVEENPRYYFPPSVSPTTDEEKSDAYNDGDQLIGDNVDYFVVRIGVM